MSDLVPPGSTIGVLGSGQLGRMFAIAARRLGYRVHVLSPDRDTPTGQVADLEFRASYDDFETVSQFVQGVDVVTFEFENVPAKTIDWVSRHVPVRPGGHVLHTTQDRLREKTFLKDEGIPVTEFRAIRSPEDIETVTAADLPAILKTAGWGYDGKGQRAVKSLDDLGPAWRDLDSSEAILERFVDFACEISVVGARGADGSFVHYEPVRNVHRNHILDVSSVPAKVPPKVETEAIDIARAIFEGLDVVGVLCVEFFVTRDDRVLVNELAPRPHNSGHLTVDAHVTCQFEQQARAVCGLPLGSTERLREAAMVNLLGDVLLTEKLNWPGVLSDPDLKLHLYGKHEARVGRKMGHLTVLADDVDVAVQRALEGRENLGR